MALLQEYIHTLGVLYWITWIIETESPSGSEEGTTECTQKTESSPNGIEGNPEWNENASGKGSNTRTVIKRPSNMHQ